MTQQLAILGGEPTIRAPLPHDVWPPPADATELAQLAAQRNMDIGIRGRTGPIAEFEDGFKRFLDGQVRHAITFNSGTSALLAAYFAVGVDDGVEVIGPALTYHAALSPVYTLRGDVVLADIDVASRCIDPRDVERRITEKTRVITIVHQWGHPANMDALLDIARRHRLKIVEDCSHAHGSRYKGRLCGTFGDVAVFSLQTNKAIFAGEGGILVTNDDTCASRATALGHYRDRCKQELRDPQYQKYWVTGFGLKLRMSPFNAIVAMHSLNSFARIKEDRHRCLRYFATRLREIDYVEPPSISDDVDMGAWYGFKPMYRPERLAGLNRDVVIRALRAEGMDVEVPSGPVLASQPLYSEPRDFMFPSARAKFVNHLAQAPNAAHVEAHALSLPTFWRWDHDKPIIDAYIGAFHKIGNNVEALARSPA